MTRDLGMRRPSPSATRAPHHQHHLHQRLPMEQYANMAHQQDLSCQDLPIDPALWTESTLSQEAGGSISFLVLFLYISSTTNL